MPPKAMNKKGSRFSRSTRASVSSRTMSRSARGSVRAQQRAFTSADVWIEDKDGRWVQCKILDEDGSVLSLQNSMTREIFAIDSAFQDIYPCNTNVVSDMTSLRHHSEPGILHNIKHRWLDKNPYTFMGPVLIAANPCEWYCHADINQYVGRPINPDISHPFAIAELSYQQLCVKNASPQAVVISGESGAGKTESSKIVLHYLVSRASAVDTGVPLPAYGSVSTHGQGLESRLLQTSPILEAFGNAKTLRNPNSSRFGKYMKINFHPTERNATGQNIRRIAGAEIETYLLEKSRVTSQGLGEQNYHAFYNLLAAKRASDSGVSGLRLTGAIPEDYHILQFGIGDDAKGGGSSVYEKQLNGEWLEQFQEVQQAMRDLSCNEAFMENTWRTVAAILETGNIRFVDVDTAEGVDATVENAEQCALAAELMGVTPATLAETMTKRTMTTRGETYHISLKALDATHARNALCKTMYSSLFSSIVNYLNSCVSGSMHGMDDDVRSCLTSIGVLDIFGYESFELNSFEQLLINYANESLQCTFNQQVFLAELRLFEEEQVKTSISIDDCPSNVGCVSLIAGKPPTCSVLATLQAVGQVPNASDELFCENLHRGIAEQKDTELSRYFIKVHPKDKQRQFKISHFAGTVTYTVGERGSNIWVDKNNDDIPVGIAAMLQSSSLEVVRGLASESAVTKSMRRTSIVKKTVASEFSASMTELHATLTSSQCVFIRCIKPNFSLKPGVFDDVLVLNQVRCLGLVQVCAVMKVGFPTRITFAELKTAVNPIMADVEAMFRDESEEVFISCLLWAFDVPEEVYHLGMTRVFFKSGQLDILDSILSANFAERKGYMIERLKQALAARAAAKEIIDDLQETSHSLNESLETSKAKIDPLLTAVGVVNDSMGLLSDDVRRTKIKVSTLQGVLTHAAASIDDVTVNGQDLTSYPAYASVQDSIDTANAKMLSADELWKSIDESTGLLEEFCGEGTELALSSLANESVEEIKAIEDLFAYSKELIHTAELLSNRCPLTTIDEKAEECENKLALIKYRLKKANADINERETRAVFLRDEISGMHSRDRDVDGNCCNASAFAEEVEQLCRTIRQATIECRHQLSMDEKERAELEEAARAREAEERRKREEAERAAEDERRRLLEAQIVEERRIAAEKAREAEERTRRIAEEEAKKVQVEEFGTQMSSAFLQSICEDEEEDFADAVTEAVEDLPAGWTKKTFTDGKSFYVNMITNKGQLLRPTEAATADFSSADAMVAEQAAASEARSLGRHKGHLQKKAGFLGLWHKCYVVLECDLLDEYPSHSSYTSGVPPKNQMILKAESDVAYDHSHLCFTVTTDKMKWKLMAENMWELRHWTNALAGAIGKLYDEKILSATSRKNITLQREAEDLDSVWRKIRKRKL